MDSVVLVVFDVGGTVVEDHGQVPAALMASLNENGVGVSPEDIHQLRGASKHKLISSLVARRWGAEAPGNEERVSAIYEQFQTSLERAYVVDGLRPIDGARTAISRLRERDIAVAVTTGFSRRIAEFVLSESGLDGLFDVIVTDDDVSCGRPAPYLIFRAMELTGTLDVRTVINVGDTPLDLMAGHNAGVSGVVGVLTGPCSSEELRKHPHTDILPSVAALPDLVEARLAGAAGLSVSRPQPGPPSTYSGARSSMRPAST